MEIDQYLNKMKNIQKHLLEFLEKEEDSNELNSQFIKYLDEEKIRENKHYFKSFLYLILSISNNHRSNSTFYSKIYKIIKEFEECIKNNFSNFEIFTIFENNMKILCFLIHERVITVDKSISNNIKTTESRLKYFFNEIKSFLHESEIRKISKSLPKDYEEKRLIGENENVICSIIRNDSIDEFKDTVEKNNVNLNMEIKPSIFETNACLIDKTLTLLEYAAFFGSIKIFSYLLDKKVEITPSLWLYAIHGQNIELINKLHENQIMPEENNYEGCLIESIKSHYLEIQNLIQNKYMNNENPSLVFSCGLQYYNFANINKDLLNQSVFYDLCNYDYYPIVELFMKDMEIDVNNVKIL